MNHSAPHYQVGGAIQVGALYVKRHADRELVAALGKGEFCYILAPRQIGKSSLRIRAGDDLMLSGIRCVSIDLSGIGTSQVTSDQWYYSIAYEIATALHLDDFDEFWEDHPELSPVHRWYRFLRDQVLEHIHEPVVVFIDEVDSVLTLEFPTDDFFASIRAVYNLRAEYPNYERLTFCLLGVAAPSDLIQNPVRTPFNIGREIRLEDFSREEVTSFAAGLDAFGSVSHRILDAVYAWTSGHPYMTQRLCNELARRGPLQGNNPIDRVDEVAYALFIRSGRSGDATVAYA
ncbi:MAG: AAA-like domain-containing protein, partial [Nannocystaceae bacterium]